MSKATKVAIVTGGGQGIGKCIALRLLEADYAVVLAELDEEAGNEAEGELKQVGNVVYAPCDISDEASVQAMIADAEGRFGGIDLLVNNAGTGVWKSIDDLSLAEWNRVLAVNLTGAFLCAKHCAPHLRQRDGSIVNIGSTRAYMSERHTAAYTAAKGGLVALTHSLAVDLGPVRVNCISPGWIEVGDWKKKSQRYLPEHSDEDRAQHPVGRVGVPDDIASLVLFLASPKSGFITGVDFIVDGGMTRKMIYVE